MNWYRTNPAAKTPHSQVCKKIMETNEFVYAYCPGYYFTIQKFKIENFYKWYRKVL